MRRQSGRPRQAGKRLLACPECDLLMDQARSLLPGQVLACPRCGAELQRSHEGLERAFALLIATAILFLVSSFFPIVGIETQGNHRMASLPGAVEALWEEDMPLVAGLVFATTILAPTLEIFVLIAILAFVMLGRIPAFLPGILRLVVASRPWSMVEVFMLGVLVATVKLSHLARIEPGIGLWAYAALILLYAMTLSSLDMQALWSRVGKHGGMA